MKMKFQSAKGKRIKSYGYYGWSAVSEDGDPYWLVHFTNRNNHSNHWASYQDVPKGYDRLSSMKDAHSLKTALRQIRKSNLPSGAIIKLSHRYIGHDVTIVK